MKRGSKIFIAILALLLALYTQNVNAEISVTPGSGGVGGHGGCDDCSYVYSSSWYGVRLSLYKYDEKKLEFKSSVDLVNYIVASKANTTKQKYGRYSYTKLGEELDFGYYDTGVKLLSSYGFSNISGNSGWGIKLAGEIQKYFGETNDVTRAKIQSMFGVNVSLSELPKYYLVAEPTIYYYNRPFNFYTYATGYEYMRVMSTLNGYQNVKNSNKYGYNLWVAQGNATIRGYLFNGMYNATNSSKKFAPETYSDGRYDRFNFLSHDSNTSLIKTKSSIIPEDHQSEIESGYKRSNYEYGAMIFWIGESGCTTTTCGATCKTECAGLSGDDLLKCGEKYCSTAEDVKNSTSKAKCIKDDCGYTYTPLSCGTPTKTNGTNTTCGDETKANKKECSIINKTYYSYKVECTTKSNVKFPSILPKTIQAGEGFEYRVRLSGNKYCTFTFDTAKWKFEYAAAYSNSDRTNYLNAITNFNALILTSNEEYKYDSKTAEVSIDINEKKQNQNSKVTKNLIAEEKYYQGDDSIRVSSRGMNVYSYHNNQKIEKTVKKYTTNSSNGVYYQLPSVCVSSKDHVTVKEGTTCGDDNGPYNKYFTNIYADNGQNDTKASVKHEAAGMDVKNDCNYTITQSESGDLECYIDLTPDNVCSEAVIDNTKDIVFKLYAVYKDKTKIIQYNLDTTGYKEKNQIFNNKDTYKIQKNTITTTKTVKVYGTVSDGTYVANCEKEVIITPQKCQWTITKDPSTGVTTATLKEISDTSAKYYTKLSTSEDWLENKSISIKKNVKAIVNGKIKTSTAEYTCEFNTDCDDNQDKKCKRDYLPAQKAEIREHCAKYWNIDLDNYTSFDDCYISCTQSNSCDKNVDCTNITKVRNECKMNYSAYGYETEETCVNDCSCTTGGIDYYYRTIENNNPFPQRDANANWLGFEKYITNDVDDSTSSTSSGNPEYEIVLDEGRIKKIQKHNKEYNKVSGNDAYNDYVWEDDEPMPGSPYKSKFIHNDDTSDGGFRSYFTYIEGSKVS